MPGCCPLRRHACTQVVGSLRARLADTTKGFQEVMTVRQDNLKAHQGRRQLFSALPDRPTANGRPGIRTSPLFPFLSFGRKSSL